MIATRKLQSDPGLMKTWKEKDAAINARKSAIRDELRSRSSRPETESMIDSFYMSGGKMVKVVGEPQGMFVPTIRDG